MATVKLITWNVNSIRIRMELLQKLTAAENPDIICLQEVKAKKEDFPWEAVKSLGFEHIALYSIPGYNGVAILSKLPLDNICEHNWVGKQDARHICATVGGSVEIHNIYIPAGGDLPDPIANLSFAHKLAFVDDIAEKWEQQSDSLKNKKMLICGDFNIAPLECDDWNHKAMLKIISHTPVEIERISRLKNSLGFVDVIREFYPEPQKIYSWWSYRNPNWQTNDKGRRLDHVWVTEPMKAQMKAARILKDARSWERPSDHVPVIVEFDI